MVPPHSLSLPTLHYLSLTCHFLQCIRVIVMFCCTRAQRKKAAEKISGSLRKHDSGPMFARLEEFDVLTPLQTTPAVSIASGNYKVSCALILQTAKIIFQNYGSSSPSTSSGSDSRIQLLPPILSSSSSDSPPPPRRPNHGKTLIVPLNASRCKFFEILRFPKTWLH